MEASRKTDKEIVHGAENGPTLKIELKGKMGQHAVEERYGQSLPLPNIDIRSVYKGRCTSQIANMCGTDEVLPRPTLMFNISVHYIQEGFTTSRK